MKVTRLFRLDQQARKGGGDRYEEIPTQGESLIMGRTYINQVISRQGGKVAVIVSITIEVPEEVKS